MTRAKLGRTYVIYANFMQNRQFIIGKTRILRVIKWLQLSQGKVSYANRLKTICNCGKNCTNYVKIFAYFFRQYKRLKNRKIT